MYPSKKAASNTKEHTKRPDHKSIVSASHQTEGQVGCAFCGRGEEATEICGKLYTAVVDEKISLAAHRKCMQYSLKLVQYTFDSFGGFKIDKVQKELKRGNKLTCCICTCKTLSAGGVMRMTSATSKCAGPGCRKAFHFYCAAKNHMNSRRKRLYKSGKELDVYSVFCCKAHKNEKISDQKARGVDENSASESEEDDEKRPDASSSDGHSLTRKSSASASVRKKAGETSDKGVQDSSSEDGGEEENEWEEEEKEEADDAETEEGDGSNKKSDEEDSPSNADEYDDIADKEDVRKKGSACDPWSSLSTSSDSSDSDAKQAKRKDKRKTSLEKKFPPKPKERSPKSDKKSPTSDKKSPKSDKKSPKSEKKSLTSDKSLKSERKKPEVLIVPEQGQKHTSYDSHEESDCSDTPSNKMEMADRIKMTRRKKSRQEEHAEGAGDAEPSRLPAKARKRLDDASKDSASKGVISPTTAKKKKVSDSVLPECVLVVPVDQTVAAAVCSSLAEKYSVDVRHVHDWTSLAPFPLPQGCMYHYYSNIATHLISTDWAKLGQLLIDGETIREKFQHEYLQQASLYEQESTLLRDFVNTTQKMLEITIRKVEERFGSPVVEFSSGTQEEYLALAISDTSDPDKVIRTKLHAPANLFEWKQDTDFDLTFAGSPPLERMQWLPYELTILQSWLAKAVTHVLQAKCIPNDVDMHLDFEPGELDAFSKIQMKVRSLKVSRVCPNSESVTDPVTMVLLFHKIDKEVLIFEHYLERVLKRYIDENKARHIICIIPSCNLKGRGRHVKRFVNNSRTKVKVSSAFDPTQRPVMFIIMDITTGVNT